VNSESIQDYSLQVIIDNKVIFQSYGKWIYPLFDLEVFLEEHPICMTFAEVRDKVIGKAAAMFILRLGAGRVHGDVMSELAVKVLSRKGIFYTFDKLVKRIDCQTEEILLKVDDPDIAYRILCQRANQLVI
jgi:hypothetical protein